MGFYIGDIIDDMTAYRGINLGGWLVAERWMTPELFQGLSAPDERSLQASRAGEGRERLEKHRQEFITEQDIAAIAGVGFTFVRLPVGYWLWREVDGYLSDAYIVGRLLEWCKKYDLKVIISLHGAPGSQNGWDHSGQMGSIHWQEPKNIELTLGVIEDIVRQYGHHSALLGVNLLNEPHPSLPLLTLVDYYQAGHAVIREYAHERVRTIVSDSFRPAEMGQELAARSLKGVVLDVHLYQVFEAKHRALNFDQHIEMVETNWKELLRSCGEQQDMMVGEWTAMLAAETFSGLSDQTRRGMVKRFYDVQRKLFDSATWAHAYWSYKTGGESVWNWSQHDDLTLGDNRK